MSDNTAEDEKFKDIAYPLDTADNKRVGDIGSSLDTNDHQQLDDIGSPLDTTDHERKLDDIGYPVDRGWSWVIVIGAFGVLGLVVGGLKSFGVLLVELSREIDAPAKVVTSTQSLAGFLHAALVPLGNVLGEKYSHRVIILLGGIMSGLGLITTAFVRDVGLLFVTYGIIAGIGFGLVLGPVLVMLGYHFKKRIALANGLADSGIGAGSFIFPNFYRVLMSEYGLQGCCLIIGALMLNICVFALLFRPLTFYKHAAPKSEKRQGLLTAKCDEMVPLRNVEQSNSFNTNSTGNFIPKEDEKHSQNLQKIHLKSEIDSNVTSSSPCIPHNDYSETIKTENEISNMQVTEHQCRLPQNDVINDNISQTKSPDKKQGCCSNLSLEWRFLKDIHFLLFNFALIFGVMGQHTVFNCLPSLANEMGFKDKDGALLVSIVGISDMIGKIFFGWFSDLGILKRETVFHMNLVLFSIFAYMFPHFKIYIVQCVISAFAGFFSGGYIGIEIAVMVDKFGSEHLSSTWGFIAFFASFAMLLNPFIAGLLRDTTSTWTNAFYFCATSALFGFCLLVIDRVTEKCQNNKHVIN